MNYTKDPDIINRVVVRGTTPKDFNKVLGTIFDIMTDGGYCVTYTTPIESSDTTLALTSLFDSKSPGLRDYCWLYNGRNYTIHVIKYSKQTGNVLYQFYGFVIDLDDDTVAVQLQLALS
jgi:hypothetical protein